MTMMMTYQQQQQHCRPESDKTDTDAIHGECQAIDCALLF